MGNIPNGSLVYPVADQCVRHSVEPAMRRFSEPEADYTSMQTKIPAEFWADHKAHNLIEQNAPVPAWVQASGLSSNSKFQHEKEQSYE